MNKIDEVLKLKELLDSGLINQSDFDRKKKEIFEETNNESKITNEIISSEVHQNIQQRNNNSFDKRKCPQCGSENHADNNVCIVCKTDLTIFRQPTEPHQEPDVENNKSKYFIPIVLIGLLIIFGSFYIFRNYESSNNEDSEETIDEVLINDAKVVTPEATTEEKTFKHMIWMSQNLNVDRFRNGEQIPYVESMEEWKIAGKNSQPAWCYYNNDPANEIKFGKLYNWYAVNDPRGIAPIGWHIPSKDEWNKYIEQIGKEYNTNLRMYLNVAGRKMKSKEGWEVDCNGTNESGFSGYPCGLRSHFGSFEYFGHNGFWWSTTEFDTAKAYLFSLYEHENEVVGIDDFKAYGFSVRCIKD